MTKDSTHNNRLERTSDLQWVPIGLMCVSPLAQREMNRAWVNELAMNLDIEEIGTPVVNKRNGRFFVVDGQHRVEALRQVGWGDQQIQCWVYEGLTETEEAEKFLRLNKRLNVQSLQSFRIAVQAGRPTACDIDRIVRANDCKVTGDKVEGGIAAVGTLIRIYERAGARTLSRTIGIIRDAFGTPGLEADLLDGIGYLCDRYETELEDELTVVKLHKLQGGVNGLRGRAEIIRQRTGLTRGHSVAAAAVDVINAGRGGKKLASWFREDIAS